MQQTLSLDRIAQIIEANSESELTEEELVLSAIAAPINDMIKSGEIGSHREVSVVGLVNGQQRAMTPEEAFDLLTCPGTTCEKLS